MDLEAIFVPPEIVIVLARVAKDVHNRIVVAHEVIGEVHECAHALRRVILNRLQEIGVLVTIPIGGVRHVGARINDYFVLVSFGLRSNINLIVVACRL